MIYLVMLLAFCLVLIFGFYSGWKVGHFYAEKNIDKSVLNYINCLEHISKLTIKKSVLPDLRTTKLKKTIEDIEYKIGVMEGRNIKH